MSLTDEQPVSRKEMLEALAALATKAEMQAIIAAQAEIVAGGS